MCGGNGSRLWPLSRDLFPKQFLTIGDNKKTMFQETCLNAKQLNFDELVIVCNKKHEFMIEQQIKDLNINNYKIIIEPFGRDTCAAITSAVLTFNNDNKVIVLTSDHIWNSSIFNYTIKNALNSLDNDSITFLGIKPKHPETGYGYLKVDENKNLLEFKEKPNKELAEQYLKQGNYYWNSGVFLFNTQVFLNELENHCLEIKNQVHQTLNHSKIVDKKIYLDNEYFSKVDSISVDYAIMEKHNKGKVFVYEGYWCDIGSFQALYDHKQKDKNNNVGFKDEKNVYNIDSKNCFIHNSTDKIISTIGIDNTIIVNTDDALLIADKNRSQDVKKIVKRLEEDNRHEKEYHTKVYRPWGWYINVHGHDNNGFKVKHIGVYPGKRLSLQSHNKRSEHWVIVKGNACVQVGKDFLNLEPNQHVYIPKETLHRMENKTDSIVEFVETQIGSYLGEDDIVRYEDDFGRV